ncbi:neuromedin-B isoform X2 [Suncus etruscus]|uniref:neuromedin-B isoform X2 n=1 Tax=Suncus etruscus TaxID=109475 RepID=UPI002110BFB6|nr:neuromedin-B isoform X2 [Suncus etruscus]
MSRWAVLPGRLVLLLALVAAGTSWDLLEPRGRALGKIRVHPRGNLWATGHFMGKKSLESLSPPVLRAAPRSPPPHGHLQLSPELLRILLLKAALGLESRNSMPPPQYRRLLEPMLLQCCH